MLGARVSRHGMAAETASRYTIPSQKLSDLDFRMERTTGIEPASSAWKAEVLAVELRPLDRRRISAAGVDRYVAAQSSSAWMVVRHMSATSSTVRPTIRYCTS